MSFWTRNPYEADAKLAENLSESPTGGSLKMWLLGVGMALIPISYGIHCLLTGQAKLWGRHRTDLDLTGAPATAMAIAYIAVGVFFHAHWFWGLHHRLEPFSSLLKVLTVLVFLGSLGYVGYAVFAL